VILSACNTAGASGERWSHCRGWRGRTLLVAHWAVGSVATVKLITQAVGATTHDMTLGRAEALRRIDKGNPAQAYSATKTPAEED
jgi:hypothetical protein